MAQQQKCKASTSARAARSGLEGADDGEKQCISEGAEMKPVRGRKKKRGKRGENKSCNAGTSSHSERMLIGSSKEPSIGDGLSGLTVDGTTAGPVVECNAMPPNGSEAPPLPDGSVGPPLSDNSVAPTLPDGSEAPTLPDGSEAPPLPDGLAGLPSQACKKKKKRKNKNKKGAAVGGNTCQNAISNSTTTHGTKRVKDDIAAGCCKDGHDSEKSQTTDPEQSIPKTKKKQTQKNLAENLPEEKLQGLVNIGNTCYLNAALQLLCSADMFREVRLDPMEGVGEVSFVHQFINFMRQMREKRRYPLDPSHIKSAMGKACCRFSGDSEQDSQEFLTTLLERVHSLLKAKQDLLLPAPTKQDHLLPAQDCPTVDKVQAQAEESWGQYLQQHGHTVVVELFQGQLISRLKCAACGHAVLKSDPFMFLSVPVPASKHVVDLQQCLQRVTKKEIINGWPCPGCHKTVDVEKKVRLWRTPPFLMLYLKRYTIDENGQQHKVCTPIQFPIENLDLSNSFVCTARREDSLYDLCAVINHSEYRHSSSGHYTAVSKCGDQWYSFDDDTVTPVQSSEVAVQISAAYVLLYKRSNCENESKNSPATFLKYLSELQEKITEASKSAKDKEEMAEILQIEVDRVKKKVVALGQI